MALGTGGGLQSAASKTRATWCMLLGFEEVSADDTWRTGVVETRVMWNSDRNKFPKPARNGNKST